jgi:hypothetical protein
MTQVELAAVPPRGAKNLSAYSDSLAFISILLAANIDDPAFSSWLSVWRKAIFLLGIKINAQLVLSLS